MNTRMKENLKENIRKELNPNNKEYVCGSGVITGFFDPYPVLGGKPKKDKAGNERKDQ